MRRAAATGTRFRCFMGALTPVYPVTATGALASLLDLRGSVALADVLDTSPALRRASLAFRNDAAVYAQLDAIAADMGRRMRSPFTERPRIPDAAAMYSALASAGLLAQTGNVARAGRVVLGSIANSFRTRLNACVDRVMRDVAALRASVTDELAMGAPTVARLASLDRALADATAHATSRALDRVGADLERIAMRELTRSLRALPARAEVTHLEPWFGQRGWARALLLRIESVTCGCFEHERAVLETLVGVATGRSR